MPFNFVCACSGACGGPIQPVTPGGWRRESAFFSRASSVLETQACPSPDEGLRHHLIRQRRAERDFMQKYFDEELGSLKEKLLFMANAARVRLRFGAAHLRRPRKMMTAEKRRVIQQHRRGADMRHQKSPRRRRGPSATRRKTAKIKNGMPGNTMRVMV